MPVTQPPEDGRPLPHARIDPEQTAAALGGWLIAQGLACDDLTEVLRGLGQRLTDAGMALARLYVTLPALHPDFEGFGATWRPRDGADLDHYEHGGALRPRWQVSPIKHCIDNDILFARWRLDEADLDPRFPILAEFRDAGLRDYLVLLKRFGGAGALAALPGVASTWASDRPGGFTDTEVALIRAIDPMLALVGYRIVLRSAAEGLLNAYVGRDAGRRILGGQVQRGSVERIAAVVMVADLRGFTALADRTPAETLVAWLNEYLAAIVGDIDAAGGEVLKYLGDGLLAIFPLDRAGLDAHGAAVAAAQGALARIATLNAARARAGLPVMALDIVLHQGEVMYGNIGAAGRLDFTVIGPTVNEAARMEPLCGMPGVNLLLSAPVAEACGRSTRALGEHALRGLAGPRPLFTLDGKD